MYISLPTQNSAKVHYPHTSHNQNFILVLPFDNNFSRQLAFNHALKKNADEFMDRIVIPKLATMGRTLSLLGATDGETFGHHDKDAIHFLSYFVTQALSNYGRGISMIGVNELPQLWNSNDYKPGKIIERSAWSCQDGNLQRWQGPGRTDDGYNGTWKIHFSRAFLELNNEVTRILHTNLGNTASKPWWENLSEQFTEAMYYQGGANTELSLLAAKASALAANTSCGTFYNTPGTSGLINIAHARQTLEHLKDAQMLHEADQLKSKLITHLHSATDPITGQNLADQYHHLLEF